MTGTQYSHRRRTTGAGDGFLKAGFGRALPLAAVLLVLFFGRKTADARQEPLPRYTLKQVVALALEKNRSLSAARFKVEESGWNVKKAYAAFLPKISLSQRITQVDDFSVRNANFAIEGLKSFPGFEDVDIPPLLFKNTFQPGISVTMPLYTGGRRASNLETAKLARESDALGLQDAEKELILRTVTAYIACAQQQEIVRVNRETLEHVRKNLENVRAKNRLGLRPKSDILRWESQVAINESGLVEAENAAAISRLSLSNIAGIPLADAFVVEGISADEFSRAVSRFTALVQGDSRARLDMLYAHAVRVNPGIQLASLQTEISRSSEKAARSGFLPQVNLAYNYSWQGNDTPELDGYRSWDATINISYSLFNGFGDFADVQKSRAQIHRSEKLEEDIERNLKMSVFTAFNTIKAALARIILYEKNLTQAQDNLKLIQSRYNLGLASNIDLVDAQVLETTARVNKINAQYDLLIAGAELERYVGVPVESLSLED